jgi:hypothetical protein
VQGRGTHLLRHICAKHLGRAQSTEIFGAFPQLVLDSRAGTHLGLR